VRRTTARDALDSDAGPARLCIFVLPDERMVTVSAVVVLAFTGASSV
jgi:hypothetical protein